MKKCYVLIALYTMYSVEGQTTNLSEELRAKSMNTSDELVLTTQQPDHDFEECKPYDPTPDFETAERRISEIKCDEYIWNIKLTQERQRRSDICLDKHYKKIGIMPVVAGGYDTYSGEFPHMGAIGWRTTSDTWKFKCGGSLISSNFVLTAAHCSKASLDDTTLADPNPKIVRLSRKHIFKQLQSLRFDIYDVNILEKISYPEYKSPKQYYDIALIKLEHHVDFNRFVQPACLWGQRDVSELGTNAIFTGWGVWQEVRSAEGQTLIQGGELKAEFLNNDTWIWSSADTIANKSDQFAFLTYMPTNDFEECKPYDPPMPNFKTLGRRLSEAKCDEYIWNIKLTEEMLRRGKICVEKRFPKDENVQYPAAVGGRATFPGEFPHMGAIGWEGTFKTWEFKCGGSLISSKFVLTAAHCRRASSADTSLADPVPKIVRLSRKNIHVSYGDPRIDVYDVNISKIISHPKYEPPRQYYDIALIVLAREVGFNQYVQPACLWGQRDLSKLGSIATLTGWGVLQEDSTKISEELQAAVIDVLDNKVCDRLLAPACNRNWCGIQEHQICAGKLAGGVDACHGDSGGPLQVKINLDFQSPYNMYQVIGVTAFGIGCAQPNLPGVYTRVSSFIDWIEQIVWP